MHPIFGKWHYFMKILDFFIFLYYCITYYVIQGGVTMADYPDWVLQHKKKGTYINHQNGKYYLYAALGQGFWRCACLWIRSFRHHILFLRQDLPGFAQGFQGKFRLHDMCGCSYCHLWLRHHTVSFTFIPICSFPLCFNGKDAYTETSVCHRTYRTHDNGYFGKAFGGWPAFYHADIPIHP